MHKFKTTTKIKDGQLRGSQLSLIGVKSHKIKSLEAIIGAIKRNWKNRDSIKIFQTQIGNPKRHVVQT